MSTTADVGSSRLGDERRLRYRADVLLHLVRTDVASRHRGSALGWIWALGPPLLQLVATYFLFTRVIPLKVDNYPVFLLVGILSWTWFARSMNEGVIALEQHSELVRRPGFTTSLLPVVSVLVALVDYLLAVPVMLLAVGLTSGLSAPAVLLPLLLLLQLFYCAGLALLVAPLQVFLRDVRQIVGLLVSVGFWLTPVFYGRTQIPAEFAWIYKLNPMAYLVGGQRTILIAGEWPSATVLTGVAIGGLLVLGAGYAVFRSLRFRIPEQL